MTPDRFTGVARAGSVDITPLRPVVLGASGMPSTLVSTIADPLEANILALGNEDDLVLIVTLDLLYVGHDLRQLIEERISERVKPSNLFLAASHTHRAPMVDATKPRLGQFSHTTTEFIAERVGQEVCRILNSPAQRVHVEVSEGRHSAGVNRRLRRRFSVSRRGLHVNVVNIAPNPDGPRDPGVRRLRLLGDANAVVADLWSTALHPTAFPFRDRVSADFPGYVRRAIRADNGARTPVLFLQGFSGDVRPRTPTSSLGLRRLLQGRRFAGFTSSEYDAWVAELVGEVLVTHWRPLTGAGVATARLPVARESFVIGGPPPAEGWMHAVRMGDLAILGVPSEVVTEYSTSLAVKPPITDVWGVGCIDHVWGYAPTEKMLTEGGYEACGFCPQFGVVSVSPQVESELRGNLRALMLMIAES